MFLIRQFAIFAVCLCALPFDWTCGRVPHITQKRDNDAVRPRAPIMSGFMSHSVMDGTPPPGLDFMRLNQSAMLGPHVRDLFPLKSCTLKIKVQKNVCNESGHVSLYIIG
jgi:hypothetical protein